MCIRRRVHVPAVGQRPGSWPPMELQIRDENTVLLSSSVVDKLDSMHIAGRGGRPSYLPS